MLLQCHMTGTASSLVCAAASSGSGQVSPSACTVQMAGTWTPHQPAPEDTAQYPVPVPGGSLLQYSCINPYSIPPQVCRVWYTISKNIIQFCRIGKFHCSHTIHTSQKSNSFWSWKPPTRTLGHVKANVHFNLQVLMLFIQILLNYLRVKIR